MSNARQLKIGGNFAGNQSMLEVKADNELLDWKVRRQAKARLFANHDGFGGNQFVFEGAKREKAIRVTGSGN